MWKTTMPNCTSKRRARMELIGYKKCSTCKNIEKLLDQEGLDYHYREIDKETPSVEELKDLHKRSGLDIQKFFNSSGMVYRELNLKDKLKDMDLEEKYKLLASNGMLIKRPILVTKDQVLVGPQVKKFLLGE